MATKNIYKDLKADKHMCERLVSALESAYQKHPVVIKMQRSVSDVHGEDIKKLFGEKQLKIQSYKRVAVNNLIYAAYNIYNRTDQITQKSSNCSESFLYRIAYDVISSYIVSGFCL